MVPVRRSLAAHRSPQIAASHLPGSAFPTLSKAAAVLLKHPLYKIAASYDPAIQEIPHPATQHPVGLPPPLGFPQRDRPAKGPSVHQREGPGTHALAGLEMP